MDDLAGPSDSESDLASDEEDLGAQISMKDGDSFLVADPWGDIRGGVDGLFFEDTRILSRLVLLVGGRRPARLSHGLSRDNALFTFHGANLALPPVGGRATPRGVIHIERRRCLKDATLFERLTLTNFGLEQVSVPVVLQYGADFRDIFEVRGMRRNARGALLPTRSTGRGVAFAYEGLDGRVRPSSITFSRTPKRIDENEAGFVLTLAPGAEAEILLEAGARAQAPGPGRFRLAATASRRAVGERQGRGARISASDSAFDRWLEQSRIDVAVLTTDLPGGPYPYAGIPWFSTPFGRDGIITAWQMLWLDPSLARGVLNFLAAHQARETRASADATPGKILHEMRKGEMAAVGEVPFGEYYGGVDTTPLFVALAGAYLERTGDLALIRALWPSLLAATRWLETWGDSTGDGLIDYRRASERGLANQGWKDSVDSVFFEDGRLATGAIALVEVQGYAFAAWRAMAMMARALGEAGAQVWEARAGALRERVESRFWIEDRGFYAMAIAEGGEVCAVETSNPGHLLFVGLPAPDRAARVIQGLLSHAFDSGWGLRTAAVGAARYNPMSYHNGSVWPHDTALAVAGMARYGERSGVVKVLCELFDAAGAFASRMPELMCGFARGPQTAPIAYPVACMPQAWAAGATFMMVQAALGLTIDAAAREVRLTRPVLPPGVDRLTVSGLEVAGSRLALEVRRVAGETAVTRGRGSDRRIALVVED